MTTSTDNPSDKKNKKVKKVGPIRVGLLIPVFIISLLVGLYFTYFFDSHFRNIFEWSATQIHGAEVNIQNIKTSFFKGRILVNNIEVTNKKEPQLNIFQLNQLDFQLNMDALLRAKFVVEQTSIKGIQYNSKRKKPGRIIPPSKNSALQKIEDKIIEQSKEEFSENVLGDIASIAGGTNINDQLSSIKDELKSEQKINEIKNNIDLKQKEWKKRIDNLPKEDEIKRIVKETKNLKFKSLKDISTLNNNIKKIKNIAETYKKAEKDLKSDLKNYSNVDQQINQAIEDDLNNLQSRFKIPKLDVSTLSKKMFGKIFSEKLASTKKYYEVAKEYMPPPKSERTEKEKILPKKRSNGTNIKFPITTSYPLFWLKTANISSVSTKEKFTGDFNGTLKNLTSNPSHIKIPLTFNLKGDLPHQNINGINIMIQSDHTRPIPKEKISMKINSFPLKNSTLSKSEDLKLDLASGKLKTTINANIVDQSIQLQVQNSISQTNFDLNAKNKHVQEMFGNILKSLPLLTVNATATGKWEQLNWKIHSNIATAIKNGLQNEINKKITEAKRKIKNLVNDKISVQKSDLKNKLKSFENKYKDQLKNIVSKAEKSQKEMLKNKKDSQSNSIKDAGKKAVEDLKKKFKFKF